MTTATGWRERVSSPVRWHYAGVSLLALLVIGLAVRLGMDWTTTHGSAADAIAAKQLELKALGLETAPLRGLDKRVEESRKMMLEFYQTRIPVNYSSFSSRIGDLEVKSGARLSRMIYTQGPPIGDLTEISLDAGISGEYPQIMRFVNGLERDQNFFVVRAMALTGQQGGLVNLRLRVSTWMRAADAAQSGLPPTKAEPTDETAAPGKEGE
jgi:type IV pilus assembly protein PilO